MRIIAFDEAGYTGQDLINKQQPVFTFSSVNLSEDESYELISLISTNMHELKFNRLRKSQKFENELEQLLNHKIISDKTVRVAIAHKEYMIIAQTVDKLMEPLANRDGIDIYREGMNLALTNMLYYCIPVFCDKDILDRYYNAFVMMFRNKQKRDIETFYQIVQALINSSKSEELKSFLNIILSSVNIINKILQGIDNYHLDVSIALFMILSNYWGKLTNDSFDVLIDNSKPLKHYEWIFRKIKSSKLSKRVIGYGSRKITLPLKINDLHFVDSKKFPQVQIADIIAGASAYYGKSLTKYGKSNRLTEIIGRSKISELFLSPIWPHEAFTPEELNMDKSGNNAVDELTKIISEHD